MVALGDSLRPVAAEGVVADTEVPCWVTKYLVIGTVIAPDGKPITLGTMWIASGEAPPVLVLAFPIQRERT